MILTLQFIIFDILPSLFAIVIAIIIVVFGNRNVPSIRRLFLKKGSFTDPRDGQVYKIVKIGNQIWMAENLNYNADDSVQRFSHDIYRTQIDGLCGKLYSWETAKAACPEGWHLPSDEEWQTLIDFAGGKDVAGKGLKSTKVGSALRHKLIIGWRGTDAFGFSALPAGVGYCQERISVDANAEWWNATKYSNYSSEFKSILRGLHGTAAANWWSATKYTYYSVDPYSKKIYHVPSYNNRDSYNGGFLLSVRCVKD